MVVRGHPLTLNYQFIQTSPFGKAIWNPYILDVIDFFIMNICQSIKVKIKNISPQCIESLLCLLSWVVNPLSLSKSRLTRTASNLLNIQCSWIPIDWTSGLSSERLHTCFLYNVVVGYQLAGHRDLLQLQQCSRIDISFTYWRQEYTCRSLVR